MGIVRYDPFRDLRTLQEEVNRLFSTNLTRAFDDEGIGRGAWAPSVDIYENKDQIVLEAELPGMKQEDFDLTIENNVITLRGERRFEKTDDSDNYHRVERSYGSFTRSFTLPQTVSAEEAKVGIMPGFVFKKGNVGIVSKSGTLTYEASDQVVKAGLGISTAIGIGGDPIIGTTTKEAVELLMNDPDTHGIIMIGEIGGSLEADAARWIKENGNRKPVVGFIAGETAPKGRTMGHAGAIVGGEEDTAEAKKKILRECGVFVVDSPAHIGKVMAEALHSEERKASPHHYSNRVD